MGILILLLDLKYFLLHLGDPALQFLNLIFLFLHLRIHALIQINPVLLLPAISTDNLLHFFIQGKNLFLHFLILINYFLPVKLFDGGLVLGRFEVDAVIGVDYFIC